MTQLDTQREIDHSPDVPRLSSDRPHRDRFFKPYRAARTPLASALVIDVQLQITNYEQYKELRARKRRAADKAVHDRAVEAVVCDLLHRHLTHPGEWVAQPLSNRHKRKSRYRSPILGHCFSPLITAMASPELSLIEVQKGRIEFGQVLNTATTLRAGRRLIARAEACGITEEDLRIDDADEVIILKRAKGAVAVRGDDREEYNDTDGTRLYRSQLARINQWIEQGDLSCIDAEDAGVDTRDRRLRRVFNGSFTQGGRLFGGFWMNMKKCYRTDLRIDGEKVAMPDYSQMLATTLYALAKQQRPERDAYAIDGYGSHRESIKKLFAAMVHAKAELKRYPEDLPETLTRNRRFAEISSSIIAAHAPIQDYFYRGAGLEAMHHESTILVEVLLRLIDQGITALPVHDAVMVPNSRLKATTDTMMEAFKDHFGVYPSVIPV